MLADLIARHGVDCWLVNTGWSGGQYGVGSRMSIRHTRALLDAALDGSLARTRFREDPLLRPVDPRERAGHPGRGAGPAPVLGRQGGLRPDGAGLVARFEANFQTFQDAVGEDVRAAAIRAAA